MIYCFVNINKINMCCSQAGISFITLKEILYVEASSNYSIFYRKNDPKFIVTKTLKDIQELLEQSHFLRIHRQYIVNLNVVKHFNRIDSLLTIDENVQLPVARILKERLMERFPGLY